MVQKRLFIFAAYDPRGDIIDQSLVMYVRALAELGDVVFYMDNNAPESELAKIKSYVIFAGAKRHGEYDFGSYKRGYIWARDNGILNNYEWVYLVNDSVYGPLRPLRPILEKLESARTDATGMVFKSHRRKAHLQSWFIGMSRRIFLSRQFDSFITGVRRLQNKGGITYLYEQGFTRLLIENGGSWTAAYTVRGHGVYNNIKSLFRRGMPFVKKSAFVRRHGALAAQVSYILNRTETQIKNAIIENATRVYGHAWVEKFMTRNVFKITYRSIRHSLRKLFIEGV